MAGPYAGTLSRANKVVNRATEELRRALFEFPDDMAKFAKMDRHIRKALKILVEYQKDAT